MKTTQSPSPITPVLPKAPASSKAVVAQRSEPVQPKSEGFVQLAPGRAFESIQAGRMDGRAPESRLLEMKNQRREDRSGASGGIQGIQLVAAEKGSQQEKEYDGALIGGDGKAYPAGTPLSDIPPLMPSNGESKGTIVFINGVGSAQPNHFENMRKIAESTGHAVIGLHNSTEGFAKDILQAAGDKLDLGKNPAVDSLADLIYDKVKKGEKLHLMGHSQGALITSRALTDVRNRLRLEDGLSKKEANAALGNVRVETLGGAASTYPDGPQYKHYVNNTDPTPVLFGLGSSLTSFKDRWTAGKGADVHRFTLPSLNIGKNHSMPTYLEHRKDWPA